MTNRKKSKGFRKTLSYFLMTCFSSPRTTGHFATHSILLQNLSPSFPVGFDKMGASQECEVVRLIFLPSFYSIIEIQSLIYSE